MRTLFSTSGLAGASARHPWRVLGLWVVLIVLAFFSVMSLGDVLTTEANFTGNPESVKGLDLIEERLRGQEPTTETVIVTSETATVDDAAFRAVVEQTVSALLSLDGVVVSAMSYYDIQDDSLVSADRRTTLIPVMLAGEFAEASKNAKPYMKVFDAPVAEGFQVLTVGAVSSNEEFSHVAEKDLQKAEGFGLPIALLILVVVFGALVAAGVPIILALISIFVALGLTALVGRAFELSFFVTNMITMIGLAVGIDYSLFIVERYREERRRGLDKIAAIELAGGTASKAVVFSGITVVLALIGMFLVPTTIFRSLGAGAILVVIVAVAASLTLVPAMLRLLGDKIDWPRRRKYDAETVARQAIHDHETIHKGFWGTVTRIVMARPVVAIVLAVALLVGAAIPALDITIGQSGIETLPAGNLKTAFTILERDFYVGRLSPVKVVVDGSAGDPGVSAAIESLLATLAQDPQFGAATVETNEAGDLTLISAPMITDANSPESYAAVSQLRKEIVPATFSGTDARVYVTGETAFTRDFNDLISAYTPIVFAFVLGLSFLLLMVAFRSIVVPIKAILMNLLSVAATYGLLVLVFQKGVGAELLGFQQVAAVESWLPIFLFCVLFGLSMDYHVFLLSRIREHFDLTGNNRESVAVGLQSTGKIITGAALIMVVVFSGFAMGDLVMMQQMGFGLAIAVFLDATIIRSVLVPASMALLGNRNWYLPRALHWLPNVNVEGSHPAVAAAPAFAPSVGGDD
jgi:putative drug exporter of the RND superfamily